MIKCECQTWKGSERCQKSKFAFLQVYVPMESLINIFFFLSCTASMMIEEKGKKKAIKKELSKNTCTR